MSKVKQDERGAIVKHKACLIARGFVQREGIDFEEVFCAGSAHGVYPTAAGFGSIKGLARPSPRHKSAFLNGELAEIVFVKQPLGFTVMGAEHRVL